MFPERERSHLRGVLNDNLSLQDAIDELLAPSVDDSTPSLPGLPG